MSRDKQIERMAKIICEPTSNKGNCDKCGFHRRCSKFDDATNLYNANFREQSEWISVEDRLPEDCVHVFTYNGVTVKLDFYDATFNTWFSEMHEAVIPVTHWMPLPELPKMKGGE